MGSLVNISQGFHCLSVNALLFLSHQKRPIKQLNDGCNHNQENRRCHCWAITDLEKYHKYAVFFLYFYIIGIEKNPVYLYQNIQCNTVEHSIFFGYVHEFSGHQLYAIIMLVALLCLSLKIPVVFVRRLH